MISSNALDKDIRFALDAENDDHYGEMEDIVPAINLSKNWVVSIINATLGSKKASEEILGELHESKIIRVSENSRFRSELLAPDLWTITAIYPKPETGSNGTATPTLTPDDYQSYEMAGLFFIDGDKSCERLSIEEWGENKNNPLASGYDGDQLCEELKSYAYLNPITYNTSEGSPQVSKEITIRPKLDKEYVAVFFVRTPADITALGDDDINLPMSVYNLVVSKALQYISFKQGDRTNLFSVTDNDIKVLIQAVY